MVKRAVNLMLIVCLTFTPLFAAGCFGGKDADEIVYVLAVGFDKDDSGMIKVSFQFATRKPQGGGGGGEEAPSGGVSEVITVLAPNFAEARNMLNSAVALTPDLSHLKVWVISEELARSGLSDILGPAVRFVEYRGSAFVIVSKNPAEDYLRKNKPLFAISPAEYYEMMLLSYAESSYYLLTSVHHFYLRLKSDSGQAYAAYSAVNPLTGKQTKKGEKLEAEKLDEFTSGGLGRRGGNPSEFLGTAVFNGDKMVGILTTEETRMLSILGGSFKRGFLVVQDPLVPDKAVNIGLRLDGKPKIATGFKQNQPYIDINVGLEGEITSIPSGVNYEDQTKSMLLEEQTSKVIKESLEKFIVRTQAMESDVVGFGYYFRPHFSIYPEYQKFDWNTQYANSAVRITVNTKIRRTGLMWKTSPIR